MAGNSRRGEVVTVYLIGLFQGLSLVAFPAAAPILTASTGYGLSKSAYGLLFLPQVVMAIAGSIGFPTLARQLPLKRVLLIGLVANALAMTLLTLSDPLQGRASANVLLYVGTSALGLGFALTLGSISTFAGAFMPARRDVALNLLNVLLGLGTALSPLLVAIFVGLGRWWYLPLIAALGLVALIVATAIQPMELPASSAPAPSTRHTARTQVPRFFWVFAGALVIYGIAETMFGNWGTTLLIGRGVAATSADKGLSAFWAGVTVGRLAIAMASTKVPSTRFYLVLPWGIAAMLAIAPTANSAATGIMIFALGGLACSGFFPMTIGYGESAFPSLVELAAGWLIAAYQVGYGLAAFGGGSLQRVLSLTAIFRITAVGAAALSILARVVARSQRAQLAVTSSNSTR